MSESKGSCVAISASRHIPHTSTTEAVFRLLTNTVACNLHIGYGCITLHAIKKMIWEKFVGGMKVGAGTWSGKDWVKIHGGFCGKTGLVK
jgi:hypothetical protein